MRATPRAAWSQPLLGTMTGGSKSAAQVLRLLERDEWFRDEFSMPMDPWTSPAILVPPDMERFVPILFLVIAYAVWMGGTYKLARAFYRRNNLPWFGLFRAYGLRFRYLNWKERLLWAATLLAAGGVMALGSFLGRPHR